MQKCVYGLAGARRYWLLRVREELVRLGAKLSSIDLGMFYWQDNSGHIGILACHMDNNIIWGGTKYGKNNVINNLKSTFGLEEIETFVYIGIELTKNSDYSISIEQVSYTASISEISLPKEGMSDHNSPLTEAERTQYRSVSLVS